VAEVNQVLKDLKIEAVGGGWYALPNGEKVQGAEKAIARLKEVLAITLGARVLPSSLQPPSSEVATVPKTVAFTQAPSPPPRKRTKVAILGFTDSRELAPFGNPEFEIWGLNELYRYMDVRKFSRWFEIHERELIEQDTGVPGRFPPHIDALKQFPIPVYMHQHWDDIPPSVAYPKEGMEKAYPDGTYQTSSISWMIALAVYEKFEEIHVYGVDMAQQTEWAEQRPACEYWIGLARGLGIKVYVPPTSDLLKAIGQYGWPEGTIVRKKLVERMGFLNNQEKEHAAELQALDTRRGQLIAVLNQIQGAKQDTEYWTRSWAIPGSDSETPFMTREVPLLEREIKVAAPSAGVATKEAETADGEST